LHMAQLMPLPVTVSCFSKIQIGFTFLLLAYLGSPGKRATKQVCVLKSNSIKGLGKCWGLWHACICVCPCRCSHFNLGNQKKCHFSTLLFIYFRLFTLAQKKTNSNCCTAALAVYILLFSASCYLNSPSTVSRAAACCDMG